MTKKFPTVKEQDKALDEIRRILNRDLTILLSDESAEGAGPEVLERAVLFEGILSMFDILEEKVTAGVLLASKVKFTLGDLGITTPETIELRSQAELCLVLMVGPEEK